VLGALSFPERPIVTPHTFALAISLAALAAAPVRAAETKPTLMTGVADAWKRGCMTELMGLTERARAAGMGPESFGLRPAPAPQDPVAAKILSHGLPATYGRLETQGGTVWVASVQAAQPVCQVVVFDADAALAAGGVLAQLTAPPWSMTHVTAGSAEFAWKAPGQPTLTVNISGDGMGLLAQGALPPHAVRKGLALVVASTRGGD